MASGGRGAAEPPPAPAQLPRAFRRGALLGFVCSLAHVLVLVVTAAMARTPAEAANVKVVRGLTPTEVYAVSIAQQPKASANAPGMMHQKRHVDLPEAALVKQAAGHAHAGGTGVCTSTMGPACLASQFDKERGDKEAVARFARVFGAAATTASEAAAATTLTRASPAATAAPRGGGVRANGRVAAHIPLADEETLARAKDGRLGDTLVLFHVATSSASVAALAAFAEAARRLEGNVVALVVDCSSEQGASLCRDNSVVDVASEAVVEVADEDLIDLDDLNDDAALSAAIDKVSTAVLRLLSDDVQARIVRDAPADVRLYVPHRPAGSGTRAARWEPPAELNRLLRRRAKPPAPARPEPVAWPAEPLLDFVAEHARSLRALRGAATAPTSLIALDEAWHAARRHAQVSRASWLVS